MKAGRLCHRVQLQERDDPDQVAGGPWSTVATLWAEVTAQVPAADREGFPSDRLRSPAIYQVKIRWRAGVQIDQRLLWDAKVLNITNVFDVNGGRSELVLICEEGANNG